MLPMILGFLGSAFAPAIAGATGIAALASPLLAGAIGTGVGTAIEQGDIGAGLKAGLGSFVGGKLLGGLMGSTAGAAAAGASPASLARAQAAGLPAAAAMAPPVRPDALTASPFSAGGLKAAVGRGMSFGQSPAGIGALLGGQLATPTPTVKLPTSGSSGVSADTEMKPIPRPIRFPGAGYMAGRDPEFDYGVSTPFSYGNIMDYRDRGVLPYADGGKAEIEVDDETGAMEVEEKRPVAANEKTEIVDAIAAIKGQHPTPEVALGKFLAKYGEDALRDLVDSVQSGEFDETLDRFKRGENGVVRGPGDGTGVDDKVPATIDGKQDVLLSDGEFVMRKDSTDALEKMYGGGFLSAINDAGDKAPEVLKKKVAA